MRGSSWPPFPLCWQSADSFDVFKDSYLAAVSPIGVSEELHLSFINLTDLPPVETRVENCLPSLRLTSCQ